MNKIDEQSNNPEISAENKNLSLKKQLRPRPNHIQGIYQEHKRTYIKVHQNSKDQLAKLVLKEGFKIKEAAKKLSIKYATAKTIIFHLREEKKQVHQVGSRMCNYTELPSDKILKLRIISCSSNDITSNVEYQYKQFEFNEVQSKSHFSTERIQYLINI